MLHRLLLALLCASVCLASSPSSPSQHASTVETAEISDGGSPVFHTAWSSAHHDPQNSGQSSEAYDVVTHNGTCGLISVLMSNVFFSATGATSMDGTYLYMGEYVWLLHAVCSKCALGELMPVPCLCV